MPGATSDPHAPRDPPTGGTRSAAQGRPSEDHVASAGAQRSSRLSRAQVLIFTSSRYLTLGIQFAKGMLVAAILGPELFGIWGFIALVQQYLTYSGLGLQHSVTVELSTSHSEPGRDAQVVAVSLGGTIAIGMVLLAAAVGLVAFDVPLFPKYRFESFVLPVATLVAVTHLQQVLRNTYRVYGTVVRVAATDMLTAAAPLVAVALFKGEALLFGLLYSLIAATLVSIAVLLFRPPFALGVRFVPEELKRLLRIGVPLLIYNVSFYLITITARTIISAFYSVETMGYYSLAATLTSATLLGLNAVSWVIFPDILAATSSAVDDVVARRRVDRVNALYGTAVWLLVLAVLIGLPVLFWILPQYEPMREALIILLLAQAALASSFGYNCVAISRRQQMSVARLSMVGVGVVAAVGLGAALAGLHFAWVAAGVFAGAVVFTLLQSRLGELLMPEAPPRRAGYARTILAPSRIAALLLVVGGLALTDSPTPWTAAALGAFLLLARSDVRELIRLARPGRVTS